MHYLCQCINTTLQQTVQLYFAVSLLHLSPCVHVGASVLLYDQLSQPVLAAMCVCTYIGL